MSIQIKELDFANSIYPMAAFQIGKGKIIKIYVIRFVVRNKDFIAKKCEKEF